MSKTLAFVLMATLAACTGTAEVHYSGDSSRPELVAIDEAPGVSVVSNADEPTFYANHTYYLYRDQTWYQSSSHVRGWSRAGDPPSAVTRLHEPQHYVHYRHGEGRPHTSYNEYAPPAAAPAPVIRDHRESPDAPMPAEQLQSGPRGPTMPAHEPNAQSPTPPQANPLPPTQVPPATP